jgi:general secretion pathway protein G
LIRFPHGGTVLNVAREMHGCPSTQLTPRATWGFSLVELTLVVAVAAILLAIGVPSYQSYFQRAKVATARADIMHIEARIELYRATHGNALPPDAAAAGMNGLQDPWGHPYAYLSFAGLKGKGAMRKDKNLVPINSDYDLYSAGADGLSVPPLTAKPSQDDIVRANDGAYVDLAANY